MISKDLEKRYGKKLIDKIFKGKYLEGCTYSILPNGKEDYPETDITRAIREIKGEKVKDWD